MFTLTLNNWQKEVLHKAIDLHNQLTSGNLNAVVDEFMAICSNEQKEEADVDTAKAILDSLPAAPAVMESIDALQYNLVSEDRWEVLIPDTNIIQLLKVATDTYTRLMMAQWKIIWELYDWGSVLDETFDVENYIMTETNRARGALISELDNISCYGSWGIYNDKVPEESRCAYYIHTVLRHFLWTKLPEEKRRKYFVDSYEEDIYSKKQTKITITES